MNVPIKDDILEAILLDYRNMVDKDGNQIDTTKGSLVYIDSYVLASALQGIYYRLKYTENQILPNMPSSSTEYLKKWAGIYGLTLINDETDTDLLKRITDRIQYPPSGGKKQDWLSWVKPLSYSGVNSNGATWEESIRMVEVLESFINAGSISIIVVSNIEGFPDDSIPSTRAAGDVTKDVSNGNNILKVYTSPTTFYTSLSSPQIIDLVKNTCELERALGLWNNYYQSAEGTLATIKISNIPRNINLVDLKKAIEGLVDSKQIGEYLYRSDLFTLLHDFNIKAPNIELPSLDIVIEKNKKICNTNIELLYIL
jgi:hypothetical protein